MYPTGVIVIEEFWEYIFKLLFRRQYQVIEAFFFYSSDKAFSYRVQIGAMRRQFNGFNAFWFQNGTERGRIQGVSVMDKIFLSLKEPLSQSTIFLATCSIHMPSEFGFIPRISTLRVERSIANNTMHLTSPFIVSSSIEKKSHAVKICQWLLRNCFHVDLVFGSGS